MNITVGDKAYFSHVPHPVVPHKGARYYAENIIKLQASSTLLWGEILTCGRKHMEENEVFTFKKHHTKTTIYVDDKLVFKDNLYLDPNEINIRELGQYEAYTHQGSLFYISPDMDVQERIDAIYKRLSLVEGIDFGITKVLDNAYLLRILSNGGEQIFQLFSQIRTEEDNHINLSKLNPCRQN